MEKAVSTRPEVGRMLPRGFRFGVATAGFQIEGGFNGPGEPQNQWYAWERAGRVEPSGSALSFWDRPEELLDLAAGLGCHSFRLSVEWARIEPQDGVVDGAALEGYRRILQGCHDRGMAPLVTLHHFTHPGWLGNSPWLVPETTTRFVDHVRRVLGALGDLCSEWVTVNEPNAVAVESFVTGSFPPGRTGRFADALGTLDGLLASHVGAYDAIKSLQPESKVALNTLAMSIYELDGLLTDLMVSRHVGISDDKRPEWLAQRKSEYSARFPTTPLRQSERLVELALRRLAAASLEKAGGYRRALAALDASTSERHLDVLQVDFYQPYAGTHFKLPGRRTAGGRTFDPGVNLWDDRPNPELFRATLEGAASVGLPVWVVENGLCNRVRRGRSYPRFDGMTRDRYIKDHLDVVADAVDAGLRIEGYWHWTLADNYEWGSYEPRFGIFGVDRDRGCRIGRLDAMGVDAAGTYRREILERTGSEGAEVNP